MISPQQALRDQGIVRQVHAAQSVGRQIVTQQRALRQANPAKNNNLRNNPARQPGLSGQTACRNSSVKACRNSVRVCRTGRASLDNRRNRACSGQPRSDKA